jgi:hypothetical protein
VQLPAPGPDGKPCFDLEDFDDFVEDVCIRRLLFTLI